ncbi:MAG: hypothetical protein C0603_04645 [Denitrovibrio sp.]|nr:MAG: hypothetical protein C0603_04645 [Denitrovibrio sp.]
MALDEPTDADKTYTINEIDILINEEVLPYTDGHQLDYVEDQRGKGFILGPTEDKGHDCCGGSSDSSCGDDCCSS